MISSQATENRDVSRILEKTSNSLFARIVNYLARKAAGANVIVCFLCKWKELISNKPYSDYEVILNTV